MSDAKAKWLIPAPEWNADNELIGRVGLLARVYRSQGQWFVWDMFSQNSEPVHEPSEARAYAERHVREALGAEIVE